MKKFGKKLVVAILGWQVKRLRHKNNFKVISIVGSVGKTSTKFAIAKVLKQGRLVRFQEGNYNDIVSVPLVFFGQEMPSIANIFAWVKIFFKNEKQLRRPYHYDTVVIELGTDGPGQISQFAKYIECDISVITAISPEHMEFFNTIDAVGKEETAVHEFSKELVVNNDLADKKYWDKHKTITTTYGLHKKSDTQIDEVKFQKDGSRFRINNSDFYMDALGIGEIYSATAAYVIAQKLGLNIQQIKAGIRELEPVNGRMRRLSGIQDSIILDDTYNSSPSAAIAALETLYKIKAPQKIAILGNMNELGSYSKHAHEEVGKFCSPKELDLVITIGKEAGKYLAPISNKLGIETATFDNPYDAAEFMKTRIQKKAVILAKGSQNGVFAEEAVKLLLKNSKDSDKLVRQSKYWLRLKKKNFSK